MNSKARWITLRNKRRVQVDAEGRIVKGLSREARGIHVRDIVPFMSELRDLKNTDCSRSAGEFVYETRRNGAEILRDRSGRAVPACFATKDEAAQALLRDNPRLADFVQENWGSDSQAYRNWVLSGRRGTKPQLGPGDGRFDPINVRHDLKGQRRCSSILEALYVTIPSSRRWEDLDADRLWPLSEVVGFEIQPPDEAVRRPLVRETVQTCQVEKADRMQELVHRARSGRLPSRDVPF